MNKQRALIEVLKVEQRVFQRMTITDVRFMNIGLESVGGKICFEI
jgi:hypothetical protein